MPGFRILLSFYDLVFYKMVNTLPKRAAVCSSLDHNKTSLLMSDARKGPIQRQDVHLDVTPSLQSIAYSVLMNLSELMSCIGLVLNSGPNIGAALQFEASEIGNISFNGNAHLDGHLSLHLQSHAACHHEQFKPMRGVWAQMKPFMLCAFDNRVLHCGPSFPMPVKNCKDLQK